MTKLTTTSGQPLTVRPFTTKPTIIPQFIDGKFTGKALEYIADGVGGYEEIKITLNSGDSEHRLYHTEYHQIIDVIPGTISVMTFGPVVGDGKQWGNLVQVDGKWRHDSNTNQDGFLDVMRHLNPHLQPAGWVDPHSDIPVPTIEELMASVGC